MQKSLFIKWLLALSLLILVGGNLSAQAPAQEMAQAAKQWLASLSDPQRETATFEFEGEERENWHFIPKDRPGLSWKDMTPEQSQLAFALLSTGLSRQGTVKATTIMSLEKILQVMEGSNRRFPRDPSLYHVSIFGQPSSEKPWGWRIEGHHLALNFTVVNDAVVKGTPSFMGSNPAHVMEGPRRGLRVLAEEEDLGLALVQTLNSEQRAKAIFQEEAPRDIFTVADRTVSPLEIKGLSAGEMNETQRELLAELIQTYLRRNRPELEHWEFHQIMQSGWQAIQFAWAGPTHAGGGNYYMVQGKTFLLEYDNTQNNNNHVHAVWRDFHNDFGRDWLKVHYLNHPHP